MYASEQAMRTLLAISSGTEFILGEESGRMGVVLAPEVAAEYADGTGRDVVWEVGPEIDELLARGWVAEVSDPEPGVVVTEAGAYWLGRWLRGRDRSAGRPVRRPRLRAARRS